MAAVRGNCIRKQVNVVFPDGTVEEGSIWQLNNGTLYAEVGEMWYAVDYTIQDDVNNNWRLKDAGNGTPVLQGLAPIEEE